MLTAIFFFLWTVEGYIYISIFKAQTHYLNKFHQTDRALYIVPRLDTPTVYDGYCYYSHIIICVDVIIIINNS